MKTSKNTRSRSTRKSSSRSSSFEGYIYGVPYRAAIVGANPKYQNVVDSTYDALNTSRQVEEEAYKRVMREKMRGKKEKLTLELRRKETADLIKKERAYQKAKEVQDKNDPLEERYKKAKKLYEEGAYKKELKDLNDPFEKRLVEALREVLRHDEKSMVGGGYK